MGTPWFLLYHLLLMINLLNRDDQGVLLKYNIPSSVEWAKISGFDITGTKRFIVICDFCIKQHHKCRTNNLYNPQNPEIKLFSHVCMAHYDEFILFVYGSTGWNPTACSIQKIRASEALLSIQCVVGIKTLAERSSWTFWYDIMIYFHVMSFNEYIIIAFTLYQ